MTKKSSTIPRIISAVVALPVYFYALYADVWNYILVLAASLIITLCGLYEYYRLADKGEHGKPHAVFGYPAAVMVNVMFYIYAFGLSWGDGLKTLDTRIFMAMLYVFMAAVLILQVFAKPIKGGIFSVAVTLFGVVYIVAFFSHVILMRALPDGFYYIMILNIVVMLNDSGAYFGGITLGKHKTNFAVSPNKSWEGYFFGLVFSVIGMFATNAVYASFFDKHLFSIIECIVLGVVLSILGNIGDLIESAVKRDATIKDSGSIIPGHGGMWDVFDALIFTLPFFYYYLVFIKGVC